MRPRGKTQQRLAAGPRGGSSGVAGGHEERRAVRAARDTADGPNTALRRALADRARRECRHRRRVRHRDADDPAEIGVRRAAAIAVVPSVRDVDDAIYECERAALILSERVEAVDALVHIDRPSHRAFGAVVQRHGVNEVLGVVGRPGPGGQRHRVEVDGARTHVDDGRAGDAQRIDVAAGVRKIGQRRGSAVRLVPNHRARPVDRGHVVAFGRDDERLFSAGPVGDVERLRVDVADDRGSEGCVELQRRGARLGHRRIDIHPVARRIHMVLKDGDGIAGGGGAAPVRAGGGIPGLCGLAARGESPDQKKRLRAFSQARRHAHPKLLF